jgi:phosphatidylglycerol:prolipoprotein diacylglycerol transferase
MYPVLLKLGPITLHMYGLMIAVGFLTALYLMQREARRVDVDPNAISEVGFWALLVGVVGSRLLHIIMYSEGYSWSDPLGWINLTRGGLVFQGALPAVFLYTYIAFRRRGISFLKVCDIVLPYVPLGQAFGRVGCIFYGCCFGARAEGLWWGIRFPAGSPAHASHLGGVNGLPYDAAYSYAVHPTQLYSAFGLFVITGVLILMNLRFKPFVGFSIATYFLLYGILRFIVEFFRGDGNPTGLGFGVLTNQQVFCVVMVLVSLVFFAYGLRGKKGVAVAGG